MLNPSQVLQGSGFSTGSMFPVCLSFLRFMQNSRPIKIFCPMGSGINATEFEEKETAMQDKPLTHRQLCKIFKSQAVKSADGKTITLPGHEAKRGEGFLADWDIKVVPPTLEDGRTPFPGNRLVPEGGCLTGYCAISAGRTAGCAHEVEVVINLPAVSTLTLTLSQRRGDEGIFLRKIFDKFIFSFASAKVRNPLSFGRGCSAASGGLHG
jgi:hypothetical protein